MNLNFIFLVDIRTFISGRRWRKWRGLKRERDPKNRYGLPANLFKTFSFIPAITLSTTTKQYEERNHSNIITTSLHAQYPQFQQWQLSLKPTLAHHPPNAAAAFSSPAIPKPTTFSIALHDPSSFAISIIPYKSLFMANILILSPLLVTLPTANGLRLLMFPVPFAFGGLIMIMFSKMSFVFYLVGSMILSGLQIARGLLLVEMERENRLFVLLCNHLYPFPTSLFML